MPFGWFSTGPPLYRMQLFIEFGWPAGIIEAFFGGMPCGPLALDGVMGATLPKPPSGKWSGNACFHQALIKFSLNPSRISGRGYNTSRKTAIWRRGHVTTGGAHAPADAEDP